MKLFILPLMMVCCLHTIAQKRDTLRFFECTPVYSNRTSDMPYDFALKNDRRILFDDASVTDRKALSQSYQEIGLMGRWYYTSRTNWLISYGLGFLSNVYNGSISYRVYKPQPYGFDRTVTDREQIKGYWFALTMGVSKAFYIDSRNKLVLIPEFVYGLNGKGYTTEVDVDAYETGTDITASGNFDQVGLGGQLDLKMNYRLSNHFGLGLTLEHLTQVYFYARQGSAAYINGEQEKVEFAIGKLAPPRFSLIVFIDRKEK
jgi:hypothetical protein